MWIFVELSVTSESAPLVWLTCVINGDTNTGKPVLDEENPYFNKREGAWMNAMNDIEWVDAWLSSPW